MAVVVAEPERQSPRGWTRRYLPLITLIIGLLIALIVLPSALRLPQTNPTQTAEYAPVPPDNNKQPPQKGNLSSLGLGNDATISNEAPPAGITTPGNLPPVGNLNPGGKTPSTKLCVKDRLGVLRQTDDPLSPPCVADFRGNNFGSTYAGVTGQEVRILVYIRGGTLHTDDCGTPHEQNPESVYFDLGQPPDPNKPPEGCELIALRGWQKYFNDRYQTYGRFVHVFAYFSGSVNSDSPEARRSDAADNYSQVHPFAVISYVDAYENDYLSALVSRHVLNFGSFTGRSASFFTDNGNAKLVWSYTPSQEQAADDYSSFICSKVANRPVDFTGNTTDQGKPRKYGLLYTSDPNHPELVDFKDLVESRLSACGVNIALEATYPKAGYAVDSTESPTYATNNMAAFKSAGITTVLWPAGLETKQSTAAQQIGYLPEWVVAGDSVNDGWHANQNQGPQAWSHAWIVSYNPNVPDFPQQICYQAFRSVDPNAVERDAEHSCDYYDNLRQVFDGIQVAGPRLTPDTVDQGFHAIPSIPSYDTRIPACFYNPGDYTCIKDATAEWWDPAGTPKNNTGSGTSGCWREANAGARYLSGQWPTGDIMTMKQSSNPCNGYGPVELTLLGVP